MWTLAKQKKERTHFSPSMGLYQVHMHAREIEVHCALNDHAHISTICYSQLPNRRPLAPVRAPFVSFSLPVVSTFGFNEINDRS